MSMAGPTAPRIDPYVTEAKSCLIMLEHILSSRKYETQAGNRKLEDRVLEIQNPKTNKHPSCGAGWPVSTIM